jgi:TonB family protein
MRLKETLLLSSIGILMLLQGVAKAATVKPLQPQKPWDLDYGDAQCTAARDYGDVSQPTTLAILPSPNGETYELLVLVRKPSSRLAEELEGTVDFGSGPIKAWLLRYGSKDNKLTFYRFRIEAAQMAQGRAASSVTFRVGDQISFGFQLDHISPLLDGLEHCTTDLMNYWNFEGDKNGRIKVPPKGELRAVFTADDYPGVAQDNLQEGTAQYLLLINESGKVAGCHILKPSGVPALDAMGCIVITGRAKFKPALDAAGKPAKSTLVTPPITWRLEG